MIYDDYDVICDMMMNGDDRFLIHTTAEYPGIINTID